MKNEELISLYPRDWVICGKRNGEGFIIVSPKEIFNFLLDYTADQSVGNYLAYHRKNDFRTGDLVFTKWYRSHVVHHVDEKYVHCMSATKKIVFPILKRKITRHVPHIEGNVSKLVDWKNTSSLQAWAILTKVVTK